MKILFLFSFVLLMSPDVFAESHPLLLTGKVSSAQKQVVTSPRSSRWQVQIQWLEEEGKVVNKGDLVAVFDGSLIQSQLEVSKERLDTEGLELTQKTMQLEQDFLEARGDLRVAVMRVEQAKIEASVPDAQVSQFDKGKYKLTLQRAQMERAKASEKLTLAEQTLRTGIKKQGIQIKRIEEDIAFQKKQLEAMSVTAQFSGPITYATHPWTGERIAAGTNVEAAWNILDVQASGNFQIETWVHEIDVDLIRNQSEVTLVLDAYPTKQFSGQLKSISTQSEKKQQWSDSVYYPIVYSFAKMPDVKLLPGMSVRVVVSDTNVASQNGNGS